MLVCDEQFQNNLWSSCKVFYNALFQFNHIESRATYYVRYTDQMHLFSLGYQLALLQYFLNIYVLSELCGKCVMWWA